MINLFFHYMVENQLCFWKLICLEIPIACLQWTHMIISRFTNNYKALTFHYFFHLTAVHCLKGVKEEGRGRGHNDSFFHCQCIHSDISSCTGIRKSVNHLIPH